eukprot:4662832-Pleurochrysis_carterae.AAC.1
MRRATEVVLLRRASVFARWSRECDLHHSDLHASCWNYEPCRTVLFDRAAKRVCANLKYIK